MSSDERSTKNPRDPYDPYCKTFAEENAIVRGWAEMDGVTPAEWVIQEEGTYNRENGHFACDSCYINIGQPSRPMSEGGWVAP